MHAKVAKSDVWPKEIEIFNLYLNVITTLLKILSAYCGWRLID